MPVPGFYNGDGGHGQAAQLDGSQDAVLVLVVQGQQLVRLLHRGLERKFALDFRPVLGYTLTRRANAISHRGHVAVGLEKRICSFFIVQGKLVPAVDLVLNPFRRVLQAVQAVDDIDRLAVHIGPALQRCQQRVAVAVDVVQNDTGPVSAPKGEQRGSQVAHKVFQNAAGDVVLLLGGFAEVPDGHSQGQRIKAGLLQRRRGHSEVERIAGGHLPVVKHLELLGQRHLRGPFDREFCAAVRLGGVFVCRLLAGRFQRLLPEAGRFLQGVDAHAVGVGGGLVLRGLVALEQRLDLADEVPHGVQQLPGHAAVFLCQGLKPGRVNRQRLGEVGGDLVHGLLRGEVHACLGVAALVLLHDGGGRAVPLGQRGHGIVAVLPVCLRGHLLHPVGDLVLCHHGAGVLGVVGNMNDAVAVPSVCAALAGGLCHLDFHPGGTDQAVVEAHGLLGQAGGMFGLHEARLVAVHRGALDALPLQGQGGRRVVLTGGVGREALRLVELRGIAALHLVHVDAGDARLVVGGEACVVVVGLHAAVIAGREGLGPVLAQAGRSVPHAADVIRLLRRRSLLLHLHGGAHGLLRGRLPGFRCGGGSFPRVRRNVALRPCKGRHGVLDGLALLGLAHVLADVQPRLLCQRVDGGGVAQNVDGGVVGHAALLGHFLGGPQQQVAAAVLRVDGLHVGLVQPPDFCVGEGLPGVELLLELHGQLVALGAGVACKPFLDGCLHHVVAHRLELRAGAPCAVFIQPCVDGDARAGHHAAGDSAAQEVQAHVLRLVPDGPPERLLLGHALGLVGVDGGLPLALVLGNEHIGHQVDDVAAHFLAALGQGVFEEVAHGALGERGFVQQGVQTDLLGDDLRRACDGAQGERLVIGQAPVLCGDGGIRRRAGAHDGKGERLVAAGDGGIQQEVAHAHAGLVGEAAHTAPVVLHDGVHLVADGAVDVAELVVACVLVDFPVGEVIRRLAQVGKALERAFQHAERGGPHRVLLGVGGPFLLSLGPLAVVEVSGQVVDVGVGVLVLRVAVGGVLGVQVVEGGDLVIRHLPPLAVVQAQQGRVALDVGEHLAAAGLLVAVDVVVGDVVKAAVGVGPAPCVEFLLAVGRALVLAFLCKIGFLRQRGIFLAPLVGVVVVLVLELGPEVILAVQPAPQLLQVLAALVQGGEDAVHGILSVYLPVVLEVGAVGVGPVLHHADAGVVVIPVLPKVCGTLEFAVPALVVAAQLAGEAVHALQPGIEALGLVRLVSAAAAVGILAVLLVDDGPAFCGFVPQKVARPRYGAVVILAQRGLVAALDALGLLPRRRPLLQKIACACHRAASLLLIAVPLVGVGVGRAVVGLDDLSAVDVVLHLVVGEAAMAGNINPAIPVSVADLGVAAAVSAVVS